MTEKPELLPCPFCGHTVQNLSHVLTEYGQIWELVCEGCSMNIPSCDSREEAVGRWNTRTPASVAEEAVEMTEESVRIVIMHGARQIGVFTLHDKEAQALLGGGTIEGEIGGYDLSGPFFTHGVFKKADPKE